jgi:hypothetical protein
LVLRSTVAAAAAADSADMRADADGAAHRRPHSQVTEAAVRALVSECERLDGLLASAASPGSIDPTHFLQRAQTFAAGLPATAPNPTEPRSKSPSNQYLDRGSRASAARATLGALAASVDEFAAKVRQSAVSWVVFELASPRGGGRVLNVHSISACFLIVVSSLVFRGGLASNPLRASAAQCSICSATCSPCYASAFFVTPRALPVSYATCSFQHSPHHVLLAACDRVTITYAATTYHVRSYQHARQQST